MADKTPIRAVFNDSNVATGLAEFQSGDTIGLTHGGLGASLSIGSAGQVLKVNSGASALEFGSVEAIVNIDGATDLESATLAVGDKLLLSDLNTKKINDNLIKVKVWERGAGLTKACGTAACATAVASNLENLSNSKTEVEFDLGRLSINIDENENIYMRGPVSKIKEINIKL